MDQNTYVRFGVAVWDPTVYARYGTERSRPFADLVARIGAEHPRAVAQYAVPEGGSHNMWVENDILYMGYYSAGARVLDVSGELRGDLYRQGREIARLWTGDPNGYRPNQPFTWGAQPHDGLIYFNDINSGVWIARLKNSDAAKPAPMTAQ